MHEYASFRLIEGRAQGEDCAASARQTPLRRGRSGWRNLKWLGGSKLPFRGLRTISQVFGFNTSQRRTCASVKPFPNELAGA